jgi:hypothetical protein
MLDFNNAIREVAKRFNAQIKEISPSVYALDIPFVTKGGNNRYQFVYAWVVKGRAKGRDCFYFNSKVGTYHSQINLKKIVREAGFANSATITIIDDKQTDGSPCETLIVQAAPLAEHVTSIDEMADIIWEVAELADVLEEKYFGGDKY